MSERRFPIQVGDALALKNRRGELAIIVRTIPWVMIGHAERQCQQNHNQSLDEVARRCGLSASEALCVIAGIPWQDLGGDETSHRILYAMRAMFERGKHVDEGAILVEEDPP